MTAHMLEHELLALPETERVQVVDAALRNFTPETLRTLERKVRRLAHPDVPEDVWIGFEEAEDNRGIEIKDEHFECPPA